jgi:hypothetical protein
MSSARRMTQAEGEAGLYGLIRGAIECSGYPRPRHRASGDIESQGSATGLRIGESRTIPREGNRRRRCVSPILEDLPEGNAKMQVPMVCAEGHPITVSQMGRVTPRRELWGICPPHRITESPNHRITESQNHSRSRQSA